MKTPAFYFRAARPVWEEGCSEQMNTHLSFVTVLPPGLLSPVLSLAGCASYVVAVNGSFVAYGPARSGAGYYRVDQIALSKYCSGSESVILSVRVAGYYARGFAGVCAPSFLCAEVTDGDRVIACTAADGSGGFTAYAVEERVRLVPRYSYQRPFIEEYVLGPGAFGYENGGEGRTVGLSDVGDRSFLVRTQPYGEYPVILPIGEIGEGVVGCDDSRPVYTDRSIACAGRPDLRPGFCDGFREEELVSQVCRDVSRMTFRRTSSFFCRSAQSMDLAPDGYADIDLGRDYAGILDFTVESATGCELYLLFDEFFGEEGTLNPFRMSTCNVLHYRMAAGKYHIYTTEPYCMRALRIAVRYGKATVRGMKMFKIAYPSRLIRARYCGGDEGMQKIYDAALETFAANAVDIYMDCPSRERAGWLCDSFFTARVEKVLTGGSRVERAFLENFLMPDRFGEETYLPKGMLPMCYPADTWDGNQYIPNWAMWYVLELEEYRARSGDEELIGQARERMYGLLSWFRGYENADGLLESLPGWVFVEWSRANELVQDVNFPTNMLYASMKEALGRLYGDADLMREASELRERIRALSRTGSGFYADNMQRRNGVLENTGICTEACQYYAFFCGVATPEQDAELWVRLRDEFGSVRTETGAYPEVAPANAFIGNYLRLELLQRYGETERMLEDIRGFFLPMAEKTGTLWENMTPTASCNHGFASHVLVWLDRAGYVLHEE